MQLSGVSPTVRSSLCRSVCRSTGTQRQTRCWRFAAVGPAGKRYLSIAAQRSASGACGGRMRAVPRSPGILPSVLWRCWLGGRKGIRPVKKTDWWGAGVVICLEQGADLHMAQLMPLPLTVSCFTKIQIGFTFLVPAHLGSPGKRDVKRMCVCVCVCVWWPLFQDSLVSRYQKGKTSPDLSEARDNGVSGWQWHQHQSHGVFIKTFACDLF